MPRNELTTVARDDLDESLTELRDLVTRIERVRQLIPAGRRKRLLAIKSLRLGTERLASFVEMNERRFTNGKAH